MERVMNSNPLRASSGRTATLVKGTYVAGVAAIIAAIWASPSYAQASPGSDMMGQMQTAVLALLATGAGIVIAVAIFFAAKALLSRVRS